ncbi:MAG: protease inhibitor I42 family protein [Specibacter sp.]
MPEVMTVRTGEMFTVDIPATPATGYQWSVAAVPAGVEMVENSFKATSSPAMVPASGTHSFHFVAGPPGTVELHFVLKRSWEPDPVDQRTVRVQVMP